MNQIELENRLILYSVSIIIIGNYRHESFAEQHLFKQLIRSSTSAPLNYGEARAAESKNDFIHKMKIILKELRESHICLRIIELSKLYKSEAEIKKVLKEVNELISIFVSSIKTIQNNKG